MHSTCPHCGEHFVTQERQGRPRRFCSPRCRKAAQRAEARTRRIPPVMTQKKRWVRHDARKRPLTVHGWLASSTRRSTWTTFQRVLDSEVGTGFGFVLGDGIGCIDLDHCIDPDTGAVLPWAQRIIDDYRPRAYMVEKSMSGTGVHIFMPMKDGRGWRKPHPEGGSMEVYSRDRYIAMTGDII